MLDRRRPSRVTTAAAAVTGRAAAVVGAALVVASAAACTGGSSSAQTSSSTSTSTRTTSTSSAPIYVAIPGLDGTSLIARFKARLGTGATELRLTSDVPAGRQSVFLDGVKKLAGPGTFTVIVGVHDEPTVYSVLCSDNRAMLGRVGPLVGVCTDLKIPGVDNAKVRSWVAAHHTGGKATTLNLERASYYFTYNDEHTMTLSVSYLGTAG
jgi:hypothetical protein